MHQGRKLILRYTKNNLPTPFTYCDLRAEDGRLKVISQDEANAIADIIEGLSNFAHFILVWSARKQLNSFLKIPLANKLWLHYPPLMLHSLPIDLLKPTHLRENFFLYYKYFDNREGLAGALLTVWNSSNDVMIYPVENELRGYEYIHNEINDRLCPKRAGVNHEKRFASRKVKLFLASIGDFYLKVKLLFGLLFSKKLRKRILGVFQQRSLVPPAKEKGAIFLKSISDEEVFLEFMTSCGDAKRVVENIFKRTGLPVRVEKVGLMSNNVIFRQGAMS